MEGPSWGLEYPFPQIAVCSSTTPDIAAVAQRLNCPRAPVKLLLLPLGHRAAPKPPRSLYVTSCGVYILRGVGGHQLRALRDFRGEEFMKKALLAAAALMALPVMAQAQT